MTVSYELQDKSISWKLSIILSPPCNVLYNVIHMKWFEAVLMSPTPTLRLTRPYKMLVLYIHTIAMPMRVSNWVSPFIMRLSNCVHVYNNIGSFWLLVSNACFQLRVSKFQCVLTMRVSNCVFSIYLTYDSYRFHETIECTVWSVLSVSRINWLFQVMFMYRYLAFMPVMVSCGVTGRWWRSLHTGQSSLVEPAWRNLEELEHARVISKAGGKPCNIPSSIS